jgi:hypothetical protein
MIATFDIYRLERQSIFWIETIDTIDAARARYALLAEVVPADYLIVGMNGRRTIIRQPARQMLPVA